MNVKLIPYKGRYWVVLHTLGYPTVSCNLGTKSPEAAQRIVEKVRRRMQEVADSNYIEPEDRGYNFVSPV